MRIGNTERPPLKQGAKTDRLKPVFFACATRPVRERGPLQGATFSPGRA